ncbi:MAG: hypothetical protein K2N38_06945 [Oscillospiraceae bacterium]|nr:hypothetical protein [Oscillospiraceae bacterium]
MKIKILKIYLLWLAVVGVLLILNANLLFPWQWEARKNKRAAIDYVNANYSEAKFVEAYYGTTKFNPENNGYDSFYFEQNGIRFPVIAEDGRVATDFYWTSFAEYQLYNTYIKPFVEPRNITAEFSYYSDLQKFFKNNPMADILQYDGSVDFVVRLHKDEASEYPRFVGWLYDFYCYCKEKFPFTSYTVTIKCKRSSIRFSDESAFANEDDFYNSFR